MFGCNDRTGWDGTIPQIRLFGSGSRVGTVLSSVVPCCPSKLEGRERTSGDDPVLAVPQPNTPLVAVSDLNRSPLFWAEEEHKN